MDDLDLRIHAWLADGPEVAPRAFVEATLRPIPSMAQHRRSIVAISHRTVELGALARIAAAVAIVAAGAAFIVFGTRLPGSGSVGASPSGAPTPTAHTVESTASHPGFRIALPDGWFDTGGSSAGIALQYGPDDAPAGGVLLRLNIVPSSAACAGRTDQPPGTTWTAASFGAALLTDPRFSVVKQEAMTIDGRTAQVYDVALAPKPRACDPARLFDSAGSIVEIAGDRLVRIVLVDVDGSPLAIVLRPTQEAFDPFVARATHIVESISFLP